jgi:hypothetical protein
MQWKSRATYELFRDIVHEWGLASRLPTLDYVDVLKHSLDEAKQKAGPNYLAQFAADLREDHLPFNGYNACRPSVRLDAWAHHYLLKKVDWMQLAQRLEEHCEQGPWPRHTPYRCWCFQPARRWPGVETPVVVETRISR